MSDESNEEDVWLNSREVRERYKISSATLNRWDKNGATGFPAPMILNGRKLYSRKALREFDKTAMAASKRRAA